MFRALILEQDADGNAAPHLRTMTESDLPPGEVTIAVQYSTVNYKDGLAMLPNGGGIVKTYPHVGGVDFAGRVTTSSGTCAFAAVKRKPKDSESGSVLAGFGA